MSVQSHRNCAHFIKCLRLDLRNIQTFTLYRPMHPIRRPHDPSPPLLLVPQSPITKELANKNGKGEAAAAVSPAAPGGIETGVGRLQLSRSATAVAASETTAAANACDTADKSPRRAHSPPPALPVPSPTEEVDQVSSTLRASASLSGQEAAVIVTVTPSAVVATAEEKVRGWGASFQHHTAIT